MPSESLLSGYEFHADVCGDRKVIKLTATEAQDMIDGHVNDLYQALAFAASCIKSGEPWTEQCEQIIGVACDLHYENGSFVRASSRGNGVLGSDITAKKTVPDLMDLLAEITGWGNELLQVTTSYKAIVYRVYQDETLRTMGFAVSTTICGKVNQTPAEDALCAVKAEGTTIEEALWNLILQVKKTCKHLSVFWSSRSERAATAICIQGTYQQDRSEPDSVF